MWPFSKRTEQPKLSTAPTPEIIAEAQKNPNGWVYQIDGKFGPDDAVPPEYIVGAYKIDENGRLTGEFQANPNYRKAYAATGQKRSSMYQ